MLTFGSRISRRLRDAVNVFALFVLVCAVPTTLRAEPYGTYDLQQIIVRSKTGSGASLNMAYVDRMIQDILVHSQNYPPTFDSDDDRQRALKDSLGVWSVLDVIAQAQDASPDILLRVGVLATCGHNLGVPQAALKAEQYFKRALVVSKGHVAANYRLGLLLAQIGRPVEAMPHLIFAKDGGLADAHYTLGLVYLNLGDKAKALQHLLQYQQTQPAEARLSELIDTVRESGAATPSR